MRYRRMIVCTMTLVTICMKTVVSGTSPGVNCEGATYGTRRKWSVNSLKEVEERGECIPNGDADHLVLLTPM